MKVIYINAPTNTNPFDFTRPAQDFLPDTMEIHVQTKGGV